MADLDEIRTHDLCLRRAALHPAGLWVRQRWAACRLERFTRGGRFSGSYAGPERDELEQSFEANPARIYANRQVPRLSRVQIKALVNPAANGKLVPADRYPFAHILKPAGTGIYINLPVVEWCCLQLGRDAGFEVPAAALVDMPDDMSPALVVERFDIRNGARDRRLMAMEDFCSVLDLPPSAKCDGTIRAHGQGAASLSTDPMSDLEILFKRALFAWIIADGDMHLKDLALLGGAGPGCRQVGSVRVAPLYDAVTTLVLSEPSGDRLARKDFSALACTIDLSVDRAEASIAEMTAALQKSAARLRLPSVANRRARKEAGSMLGIAEIVRTRAEAMG